MSIRVTTIVITIIFLASCKKDTPATAEADIVNGTAKAIIANTINDSIKITLSGLDLATGTIPHIIELTLAPNDTTTIPRIDLKDKTRYTYNWNSNNFRYSDWFQFSNYQKLNYSFDYYADSNDYLLTITGKDRNDLLICLNGDGLSSSWKAINAFDAAGTSIWATLSDSAKTHSFVINRFHSIKHNYIDSNKTLNSSLLAFVLYDSSAHFSLATKTADQYILSSNISFLAPLSTQAQDTLYFCSYKTDNNNNAQYNAPYYQLVRTSVD